MHVLVITDIWLRPEPERCILTKHASEHVVERVALSDLCGRPDLSGEALHQYLFEQGGAKVAIDTLLARPNTGGFGLGYSAGGTILWRAVAGGLPLMGLICVSSTRLREEGPVAAPTHVFFGTQDMRKPSQDWLSYTPDQHTILEGVGHDYYQHPDPEVSSGSDVGPVETTARHVLSFIAGYSPK